MFMKSAGLRGVLLLSAACGLLSGCATAPVRTGQDPKPLFEATCGAEGPGAGVQGSKGAVWIKAQSKEASGQFPAAVSAPSMDRLVMEVTNLVGASQATIKVDGGRYTIEMPDPARPGKKRKEQGSHSWGGIPLHWAAQLFSGKVPCPSKVAAQDASLSISPEGELIVETRPSLESGAERFVYSYRSFGGRPWPEALRWEALSPGGAAVDFRFDEPEDQALSPMRWEAKSKMGEVKVRWRERELVR